MQKIPQTSTTMKTQNPNDSNKHKSHLPEEQENNPSSLDNNNNNSSESNREEKNNSLVPNKTTSSHQDTCPAAAAEDGGPSGRERLKRHRVEVAGRVWIPDMWGQEDFLKDWIDCGAFDAKLVNSTIMSARDALMEEGRRANSTRLRIQNGC